MESAGTGDSASVETMNAPTQSSTNASQGPFYETPQSLSPGESQVPAKSDATEDLPLGDEDTSFEDA